MKPIHNPRLQITQTTVNVDGASSIQMSMEGRADYAYVKRSGAVHLP